jgi:hypothetical protein
MYLIMNLLKLHLFNYFIIIIIIFILIFIMIIINFISNCLFIILILIVMIQIMVLFIIFYYNCYKLDCYCSIMGILLNHHFMGINLKPLIFFVSFIFIFIIISIC